MSYISVQPVQASMRGAVHRFVLDQRGAATIDWVALTTGILLMGITVVYSIFNNGVGDVVGSINSSLEAADTNVDTGAAPDQNSFGATPRDSNGSSDTTPGGHSQGSDQPNV